jgi:hypothetical protein
MDRCGVILNMTLTILYKLRHLETTTRKPLIAMDRLRNGALSRVEWGTLDLFLYLL